MKELTIKEKAKRYDEALEIAKEINNEQRAQPFNVMTRVFPELAESEDERIRKEIIDFATKANNGVTSILANNYNFNKWIAWLEKQADHAKFINSIQIGDKVTRNEDGVLVNLSQLKRVAKPADKQGEQKPAEWSEEDEKILSDIIKDLVHPWNEYIPDRIEEEIKWLKNKLKSLKDRSAWKPSDAHYELEEFAKIVRGNLTGISKNVQKLFEAKYLQLTGNKMYGGFKD